MHQTLTRTLPRLAQRAAARPSPRVPAARVAQQHLPARRSMASTAPGEAFGPRQTLPDADHTPDAARSLKLSPPRQALVDDIIALYSCQPTVDRVRRYTPDCVYDDQFGYANDRHKTAAQWFALPKLFKSSRNMAYQVVKDDRDLIQFKNQQEWTFRLMPKALTLNTFISLSLDPSTVDSDFIQVKYHKEQANEKDYSHEGLGFDLKKWQADFVAEHMDSDEVAQFKDDKKAAKGDMK